MRPLTLLTVFAAVASSAPIAVPFDVNKDGLYRKAASPAEDGLYDGSYRRNAELKDGLYRQDGLYSPKNEDRIYRKDAASAKDGLYDGFYKKDGLYRKEADSVEDGLYDGLYKEGWTLSQSGAHRRGRTVLVSSEGSRPREARERGSDPSSSSPTLRVASPIRRMLKAGTEKK